jgi:C-terminal processing protease CtpA/Prc
LRITDGGRPFAALNIAGIFLDKIGQRYVDKAKNAITYRYENGLTLYESSEEPGKVQTEAFPDPTRWNGKLVILIGPNTFSMGEDLADLLQHEKRATLIGEPTLGAAGVLANYFTLTSGAKLLLTTHRIYRLDGSPVPLKTYPDIVVPVSLEALTHGHDSQLEAAFKFLEEPK